MPKYTCPALNYEFSRNAVIIDTCVLVDAFSDVNSDDKQAAEYLIKETKRQILIPDVVIVEAWGMLKGAKHGNAFKMLGWIYAPGSYVCVLRQRKEVEDDLSMLAELAIDYVDGCIARLATILTIDCELVPDISVATKDLRDMTRIKKYKGVRMNYLDYRSMDYDL